MKKLLLILLFLPMIGFGQNISSRVETDSLEFKIKRVDQAPIKGIYTADISISEEIDKSSLLNSPYPIIFIHGLNGNGNSWLQFSLHLNNNSNYAFGGELPFCLNSFDLTYIADFCSIISDVQSFIPLNLPSADYYRIEFDCQDNGICNTSNSEYIESNQSAIIKQGYALGIAIDKVLNATGKDKVILFAHSMGGLCAREYIQNPDHWIANSHRVAKLVTSGTPHGGSNTTMYGVLNEQSEAVRDLRRSYFTSGTDGAYLFDGIESDANIQNSLLWTYWNVDVNCNGSEGDFVTGLNHRFLPSDIDYACIYSDYFGNGSDGVVGPYYARLSNYYNGAIDNYGEEFEASSYTHSIDFGSPTLTQADYINFKALDEPEYFSLSYKIDFSTDYKGHLTFQDVNHQNLTWGTDLDSYHFIVTQNSLVNITVNNLSNNGKIELYDNNYTLLSSSQSNVSGYASILSSLNSGKYYLDISGDAYGNPANGSPSPWDNPYNFNVSSSSLSIDDALFNDKILLNIIDMLGRNTQFQYNTPLFYIYDDGTVEKRIIIE